MAFLGGMFGNQPQLQDPNNRSFASVMSPAVPGVDPTAQAISLNAPNLSPVTPGWFDDDPGATAAGRAGGVGGAFGLGPLTGAQKTQMLFAGLRDAVTGFGRNPTSDLSSVQSQILSGNQRAAKQQALAAFQNAKTPAERQAAAVALYASGGDTAGLASAMKVGQPELKDIAQNGTLAVIDPTTGLPISTISGTPKPIRPLVSNGMQSLDNGKTWAPIPGYSANAREIAGDKRAPPKTPATGAIVIPHPASAY